MFFLFPYLVDVPMRRWPIANFMLLAALVAAFVLEILYVLDHQEPPPLVLRNWSLAGLFGHMWLHAGLFHLIGNLIFLWAFGNAVCAKVGNLVFVLLFVALGVWAGAVHLLVDGRPAIGASGAMNGVVGMYLV
jgi:membrane associated rhomboid family serine protease